MKSRYDRIIRVQNERNARIYFYKRIDILSKNINLNTNKTILDIGCGEGIFLSYLKERYPKLSCFGMDIALTQFKIAKYNAVNMKIIVAEAEKVPFTSQKFDIVIFNSILHHVDDIDLCIKESLRVCKNAGTIVIIEPNRLNLLVFFLSIFKKHERGQLRLSLGKIKSTLDTRIKYLHVSFINSLCFPYQKWPPQRLLAFISRLEDSPLFPPQIRTHFIIIAKKNSLYEDINFKPGK